MRIVVVGLRGFPNIQGGIETHCEELYPRIVTLGHEVIVIRRTGFVKENPPMTTYKDVKFNDIKSPFVIGLEAAIHTFKGIWYAKKIHADIVHVHAIGPAIAIPLAKLLGLKVVMTHHGPDYDREKWGRFARFVLKTGEFFAAKMADEIIVISTVIRDILHNKYGRNKAIHLIYNGVNAGKVPSTTDYLDKLNLEKKKYILAVGRFVEEKGFDKLIKAYLSSNIKNYKLVIAGDADHNTQYAHDLKKLAKENGILLTGMIKGDKLQSLYANAKLFVLPSSHEGLPITLLEAMSYNLDVLVSDIPANKAVGLNPDCYFIQNNSVDFENKLTDKLSQVIKPEYDLTPYNWDNIAEDTLNVYYRILNNHK